MCILLVNGHITYVSDINISIVSMFLFANLLVYRHIVSSKSNQLLELCGWYIIVERVLDAE